MKNKNSISSNQQNKASTREDMPQSKEAKESLSSRNSAKHTMANLAIKTFAELLTDLKSNVDDIDKSSNGATTFEIPR